MNNTTIRPGILYINFGGTATFTAEAEVVSAERLRGTGHLSRGARGYIDRCAFPGLPNLTGGPLKRKVILILQGDIDDDAVEASVKCVGQQVEYLLGLPDSRKPKVIAYQVAASVTENGLVESYVAVNNEFTDDVFFNLYVSPGYPEFKQVSCDSDYIPEFLRMTFAKRPGESRGEFAAETENPLSIRNWSVGDKDENGGNEMNGKLGNDPWKGYPADLREMMMDVYHDDGAYSAAQVINRLSAEIDKVDIESVPDSLERIAWVDRFMRDCAMDFICHPDLWENESEAIAELLSEADDLLAALCRSGTVELRAYKSGASDENPTALAQRMNVYRCVSAALAGDVWEFRKRLSRAIDDAKANVEHLLSCPCADELIEKEDTTRYGFHLPGQRYFTDPIASLAGCAFHIGKSNHLTRAYHEYIKFLEKLGADSRGVRGRLLLDAEHILGELFDGAIDELDPEYPIDVSASDEVRRLISENPDLPVIAFAGPEGEVGTYSDISSVDIIEFLDCDPPRTAPATIVTSRQKLEELVREECEMRVRPDQYTMISEEWLDEWVEAEMAKYEPFWSKAIRINTTWKELYTKFMI